MCLFPVTDKLRDLFFQIKTLNNDTCSSVVTLTSVKAVDCQSKKETKINMKNVLIKSFKCEICMSHFAQKSWLNRHITSVHEGKKLFKCEVCDYRFSRKGDLNQHVLSVHEGKKPFKCEVCDYRSSQKIHLSKHIESVHEGRKPFKCGICDFSFSRKDTLNRHVSSLHEENKPFVNKAAFKSIK